MLHNEGRNGGWSDLGGQLQDGLLDVIAFAAGVPVPAVSQLEVQTDVNIIEFTEEAGVDPKLLEVEITESTIMENTEQAEKTLRELSALGVGVSIDDFGTGYSSLSYLKRLPIHTLKIDQSFIIDVAFDKQDIAIVQSIIDLGHNLGYKVVAEGVESEEQLNFLQTLGCNYVQGLLFGDPMSSDDYLELLRAQEQGTDTHRALFA